MEDQWQLLREVQTKEQNSIEAEAFVPTDSIWFSGHFPGEPILPGIAVFNIVWQAIAYDAGKRNEEIRLNTLKRVRFTHPVRPGETLAAIIKCSESGDESLYSFKVISKENVVCSGLIAASKTKRKIS